MWWWIDEKLKIIDQEQNSYFETNPGFKKLENKLNEILTTIRKKNDV
jgi:hypothetical protein